ncbi:hypothetical protein [uncultured Dysgonomonas sp.]|uniref:Rieske domain-containing protein n=1 Tax=uncultured Dysgonomonas sp. TaxID=206096 RepID=A0A212J3J8_9BACT|nr:hypothetical protein [uncultured Dysgonomonas sp.]SBV94029.1 conserved exported hypothetical protein [uncultured Dysgonomonas sp.]
MKKIKDILIIGLLMFVVSSCGKEEEKYTIPAAPVQFFIYPNSFDNHLMGGGNIGIYLKNQQDKENYDKLVANIKEVKTYIGIRAGLPSYLGYSGLMVVNTTLSDAPYAVFDLCCPHEDMVSIRVVPTNEGTVKCPECGSIYDIFTGVRKSGVTKENLQSYRIVNDDGTRFRIFYP